MGLLRSFVVQYMTDCIVIVLAPVMRLPDSHVYALGYGLPPL